MNRREYLDLLRYYLRQYPANIANDIVMDYVEHFRIGMENGKTEEEIARELGSPKDIADEYLAHEIPPYHDPKLYFNPQPKKTTAPMQRILYILLIVGIVFIGMIALPSIFGIGFGILAALIVSAIGFAISGFIALFSWTLPVPPFFYFLGFPVINLHPLTAFFLGLFLISFSLLLGILAVLFFSFCLKAIKNIYLSIRWNMAKRRRGQ